MGSFQTDVNFIMCGVSTGRSVLPTDPVMRSVLPTDPALETRPLWVCRYSEDALGENVFHWLGE